jgi:tetratricopeptide (TPR) repeat protein
MARALHLGLLSMEKADFISFPLSRAISQFALSQIHWRLGNKEEARAALAFARNVGARAGYALVSQGCDLLQSDLDWNEDRNNALACLRRGLAVARNGGYHNMFWLSKTTMARIAARALKNGIEPEHVRMTIIRRRLGPPPEASDVDAWVWRYRIRSLGAFEMTCDCPEARGRSSSDKTRRPRLRGMPLRLLRAILAFGARGVRDAALIDALWPDADGDAGRRVFDTTLHRLRRQIGDDDIVRLSGGRVSLNEQICWVDIWALKRALEEAERELEERAPTSARVSRARNLLAIYRGPLLADDSEYWVLGPRERLATTFRSVATRLGQKLEQSGRHLQAQVLYERALDDPASAEPVTA